MSRINLLPWRDKYRRIQNQRFYLTLFIAEMISVLLLGMIYLAIKHQTQCEINNIHFLEKEQKEIEVQGNMIEALQKDKDTLLNRIKLIQKLQAQRAASVKLLDSLPRVVPEGIRVMRLTRKENEIYLEGQANTNASISKLLKNLEPKDTKSGFQDIKLKEVLMNKKESDLRFKIQFNLNASIENDE